MSPTIAVAASLALALGACSSNDSSDPQGSADAATGADADSAGAVPADPATLFSFLQSGSYQAMVAEPSVHPSAGPHGTVRVYFDDSLATSLDSQAAAHPRGAAAIKELYSGSTLSGWAVMVKTGSGTEASDWYFYEVFSTTEGSSPAADGNGLPGCASCHSAGVDFIRSSAP